MHECTNRDACALLHSCCMHFLAAIVSALQPPRLMPDMPSPRVVAVLGPTATGKSALALALAGRFGGEIINCDSTAVFRGFDIGTDKLLAADRRGIPHHLIDVADPTEDYTAARYRERGGGRHSRHSRSRTAADSGGWHRFLLSGADARSVSGSRPRRALAPAAGRRVPPGAVSSISTGCSRASTSRPRSVSNRGISNASSGRSRCFS